MLKRGKQLLQSYENLNLESQQREEPNVMKSLQKLIERAEEIQNRVNKERELKYQRALRMIQRL